MTTLIVTPKRQITLRREILKHLGIRKISDVFGFLKRKGSPSLPIEKMNEIAARGWTGKR